MSGRVLYGTDRSQAAALITEEFYNRLRENGRKAGLGFHIPEQDPQDETQKNLNPGLPVIKVFGNAAAANQFGAGMQDGAANVVLYPDPVTGEDMKDDWQFTLDFKLVMGDAEQPADEETEEAEDDGRG